MAVYQPSNETQYPSSVYFGSSYEFTIQGDGNLVLYNRSTGKSLWSSQTATGGAFKQINSYVILQGDGNLVIRQRDKNNNIVEIWGTHTILCANQSLPKLVLQSDGNIVEEYECAHRGNLTHGFIGNTGTGGGGQSSHPGKF
ncbi:hypothetical protein CKK33_17900 [Mucilaginibacter sp. MD40]|nr:hypothetical protein CKK33_17900 [Mucilaginibacter sp. MD40]